MSFYKAITHIFPTLKEGNRTLLATHPVPFLSHCTLRRDGYPVFQQDTPQFALLINGIRMDLLVHCLAFF